MRDAPRPGGAAAGPAQAGRAGAPAKFRRILVAVDAGAPAWAGLAWAAELAALHRAETRVVQVVPARADYLGVGGMGGVAGVPPMPMPRGPGAPETPAADAALRHLRARGVACSAAQSEGTPALGIVNEAGDWGADLVVIGSHGRSSLGRLVLGSVAEAVKDRVAASVLVARTMPRGPGLLVATDGSPEARRAVDLGLDLAGAWGLPATVLHVLGAPSIGGPGGGDRGRAAFAGAEARADPDAGVRFDVEFGDAAERILARVREEGPGLVVVGCRGLSGMRSLVAGSVSGRVAREAPASVLVVKRPRA